ncbi:MAG: hypothetical protein V3V32_03535, partial [Dehalococcoidia bacterium]
EYGIEILTNDWSKYDANRAVTRTEGAGPKEINETLHQYYKRIKLLFAEIEKADEADLIGAMKPRKDSTLAWALLQGDVIENLGGVETMGDPVESLASRIAEIMPYPHHQVSESIKRWVEEGLLQYDLKGEHLVWRWS